MQRRHYKWIGLAGGTAFGLLDYIWLKLLGVEMWIGTTPATLLVVGTFALSLGAVGYVVGRLLHANHELATTEKTQARGKATAAPKARPARARDDLQVIKGIGPALEKTLNRAGVRTYRDLLGLDSEGLQRLSERIHVGVDRMRRDRWIPTARREHRKQSGRAAKARA